MATRTGKVGDYVWSSLSSWDEGAVPANGDTVILPVGCNMLFDVDQSGFANGLAAMTNNGMLHFKPDINTYLKMNGAITGSGSLYVAKRLNISGFTLTEGKTYTYEINRTLATMMIEETLGEEYLDAIEEIIDYAVLVENQTRDETGTPRMFIDECQTFKQETKAALTLSTIISYVEATPTSFYHDTTNNKLYIHTSTGADPSGFTITAIEPIARPTSGQERRCELYQNSSSAVSDLPIVRAYGWIPELEFTNIIANAAAGQNQVVIEKDLGLQVGDQIAITQILTNGTTTDTNNGRYTVSSYSVETKTITLTANLNKDRIIGDKLIITNKPIKFNHVSASGYWFKTNTGTFKMIGIKNTSGYLASKTTYDGTQLPNCSFKKSSNFGRWFIMCPKDVIIKECLNLSYYFIMAGSMILSDSITFSCAIGAYVAKRCSIQRIAVYNYPFNVYPMPPIIKDSEQYSMGNQEMYNGSTLINCKIKNGNYAAGVPFTQMPCSEINATNCIFTFDEQGMMESYEGKLYNCLFDGDYEVDLSRTFDVRDVSQYIESFNHNQIVDNYKAWHKGGEIYMMTSPIGNRLVFDVLNEDYPVFRDYRFSCPANRNVPIQVTMAASVEGLEATMEIIDPMYDPLVDSSGEALDSVSTSEVGVQEHLGINFKTTTARELIVRIRCEGAIGNVIVDDTKIKQMMSKPPMIPE